MSKSLWRKAKMEMIEWEDATGDSGWSSDNEAAPLGELLVIRSIGYVIKDTEKVVTLAQSIDNGGDHNTDNRLSIPQSIIVRRDVLKSE